MATVFLDTNIFLRHLTGDHPEHSPKATAYLVRIERGEMKARIADTVVFEVVFTLRSYYGHSKGEIRDTLLPIVEMAGIALPGKRRLREVFDVYVEENVSFADAFHATLMKHLGIEEIASFDMDFDRIPGVRRAAL
ncbi:MAG: PIN domain-containing protein [Actinomycetota bacterium]|jgi:predicted nucleic acid-binding protein|nr:PIN domain-containing protein [Actinomycetota bacterium]